MTPCPSSSKEDRRHTATCRGPVPKRAGELHDRSDRPLRLMSKLAHKRFAQSEDLDLPRGDFALLASLRSPQRIQRFLEQRVLINHEIGGDTILSVQQVLLQRRAHCIEAAFVAAWALWIVGSDRSFTSLRPCDYPHVVALLQEQRVLGRDFQEPRGRVELSGSRVPAFALAMSWFHEYVDDRGRRTLREYSVAFDMRGLEPSLWVNSTSPATKPRTVWQDSADIR